MDIYIYLYNILRKMPAAYVVIFFFVNPFGVHFVVKCDDENSFFYSMHTKNRNCRSKIIHRRRLMKWQIFAI